MTLNASASDYYWDANGPADNIGGTGNWDNSSPLWRFGSPTGTLTAFPSYGDPNNDAFFQDQNGTLTLTTGIFVNDINVDPTTGTAYVITGAQTLTLNGAVRSTIGVATGDSLTITSGLGGTNGFTKASAGTLILDSVLGTSNLTGAIAVTGGILQAGSATNSAASQVLRGNAVDLAVGTTLTTVGTTMDLRVGNLSGSGSVTPAPAGAINELALANSTFSGAITTTGGLILRGANGTTQTFNGNLTGLTGTIGVNSGATFLLSGTGNSTSGALGSVALATRGGAITLDNSAGNTTAAAGRIADTAAISLLGGSLNLIGNSAGTSETVGTPTFNPGLDTVSVTSNSTTAPTTLTLTKTGSLRDSTQATINFVGVGGTLGAGGNNPTIKFTGTPTIQTATGLFGNGTTGSTIGFATVNSTEWAGYSTTNGVVAVAPTATATTATQLAALTASSVAVFAPTATVTASGNITTGTFKITPNGGTTLALGSNNLSTTALMLAGTTDFAITGGTLTGGATRFAYVSDANTTLSFSGSLGQSGSLSIVKSGLGILNLNGTGSQVTSAAAASITLVGGVLRGTTTTLGGGTSAGGAFEAINFRGGVLEIAGGGTFSRALLTTGGTTSGGVVNFDNGTSSRGDGGFSAIGGDASVTLVTAIAGSTAATLRWNDGVFLADGYVLTMGSTKSDSVLTLTNNIGLDNTATAGGAANNYFAREIRVTDNTAVTTDATRLFGVVSGSINADLLKTGAGVLQVTATNTYAGNTLVQQGTLQIGATGGTGAGNGRLANTGQIIVNTGGTLLLSGTTGSTDRINNAAGIVLAGGTFDTGGLSERTLTGSTVSAGVGTLTLSANSIIDLGLGNSILAFENSSAQSWNGLLSIYNYSGTPFTGNGTDQLYFGTSTLGLQQSQLNQISFFSGTTSDTFLGTGGFSPDMDGEVVPVPEPSTVIVCLSLLAVAVYRERNRFLRSSQARQVEPV